MIVKELINALSKVPWNYEVQVGIVRPEIVEVDGVTRVDEVVDLRNRVELDGFLACDKAKIVIIKALPES